MANVTGSLSLNNVKILEVDGEPTIAGVEATVGTLAFLNTGKMFLKVGTHNKAWTEVRSFDASRILAADFKILMDQNQNVLIYF